MGSKIDRLDARRGKLANKKDGMQAGARRYPEAKLPGQHLSKPGRESDLELRRPMYEAPYYRGSDKRLGMFTMKPGRATRAKHRMDLSCMGGPFLVRQLPAPVTTDRADNT